jgi:hypothetical protein
MKDTFLEVKIKDKFDQYHYITYKVQKSHLAARWVGLTKLNLKNPRHAFTSSFNNRTALDVPEITQQINHIVLKINQLYDKVLPTYEVIDNPKLNYLHEEFEIFGERYDELKLSNKFSYELEDRFFALNEHIHMCEDAMVTEPGTWGGFGILYDIQPLGLHLSIMEMDKLLLETGFSWGRLYLGYNTLGKDWLAVAKDNDVEVIVRDMVKPQKRFAAETWLNFNIDQEEQNRVSSFINWCNALPFDIRKKVPFNNLNQLTLGRFPIGDIVINDTFLKIDPNPNHWKTYRHDCKLQWNHKVLTTFRSVEDIRIYEQDN